MQRVSAPFRHVTHVILLVLLLGASWLHSKCQSLPDGTALLVSGILLGVGLIVSLGNVFWPKPSRLPDEKGRTPPHYQLWTGLLFFAVAGFFILLETNSFLKGDPVKYADAIGVISAMGSCITIANERMWVCWNEEGFVLRTIWGNIHRFDWQQMTAFYSARGAIGAIVNGKAYLLNINTAQANYFLQVANKRRQALHLPPIRWS